MTRRLPLLKLTLHFRQTKQIRDLDRARGRFETHPFAAPVHAWIQNECTVILLGERIYFVRNIISLVVYDDGRFRGTEF